MYRAEKQKLQTWIVTAAGRSGRKDGGNRPQIERLNLCPPCGIIQYHLLLLYQPGCHAHMDPMKNMISEPEEKIYSIGKMVAVM